MLQYIVIVLICNYFPKLLKTHFFIYFANKMNNKKQNDKKKELKPRYQVLRASCKL